MTELNELFKSTFAHHAVTRLPEYIQRTKKYMPLEEEDFCIVAVILKVVCNKFKNINPLMYHKLYACALLVCVKMYNDHTKTNNFYGQIFGIPVFILNELELIFLDMIDWNINVTIDQYNENAEWLMENDHN